MESQNSSVRGRGRPSKLTAEVIEQIERLIAAGVSGAEAAAAAGVPRTSFYRWMAAGGELRDRVERARAQSEAVLVVRIARAAERGSWRAAAWLLERRYPERWARPADRPLAREPVGKDPFADIVATGGHPRRRAVMSSSTSRPAEIQPAELATGGGW